MVLRVISKHFRLLCETLPFMIHDVILDVAERPPTSRLECFRFVLFQVCEVQKLHLQLHKIC